MNFATPEATQLFVETSYLSGEATQPPGETLGSRWRQQLLATRQRHRPTQHWVRLAQALQGKYVMPQIGLAAAAARKLAAAEPVAARAEGFLSSTERLHWPQMQSNAGQQDAQRSVRQVDDVPVRTPVTHSAATGGAAVIERQIRVLEGPEAAVRSFTPPNPPPTVAAEGAQPTLPPAVARTEPVKLPTRTQTFLAGLLDIQIPAVKLYVNQAADDVVKSYRADALTYGDNILVRRAKYNPHQPVGLGLLGHELTHAAQARIGDANGGVVQSQQERDRQETQALQNEERVLHHFFGPQAPGQPGLPSIVGALAIAQPPGQPQAAASDRAVAMPPAVDSGELAAPQLAAQQLQQIKEAVYRDLLDRIRTEFERGG